MTHSWVVVLVCPLTAREAGRMLAGERRTFRKLDTADPGMVRSAAVMCGVCRFAPRSSGDVLIECKGAAA